MLYYILTSLTRRSSQRADEIDDDLRCSKLRSLLQPVLDAWHDPNLGGHLTSFASFLELLGIDKFPEYFLSKEAWKIEDWSRLPLDTVGQSLRDEVSPRNDVSLVGLSLL